MKGADLPRPGRVVRIKSNVFFSRVGKCTICSMPRSFIMSIKICPSDWLNVERDLLCLSGQSISLKLKSPRTWTEGRFFTLMMSPYVIKLFSKWLEFFTSATRRSIPTCQKMISFVCKHFHTNWFRFVFQFCDRHMRNVLMDEQHDPATLDISVFSIYTIWASFREEFWSCNRTGDLGFLDSYNMWLMKIKESQQFQFFFFASYAIDSHANEFQLTNKAALPCTTRWRPVSFSFVRGTNLFQFPSLPVHKRRNQKSRRVHISDKSMYRLYCSQFHTEFLQWIFNMDPHITTVTLNCFVTL